MASVEHPASQGHILRRGVARIGQEWPLLAIAAVLAALAIAADAEPLMVMLAWTALVITLLVRPNVLAEPEAPPARPIVIEPPSPIPALRAMAAGFSGIDLPVFVLNGEGHVLFQNPAAARAFGEIAEGDHISVRLRSPGVLDMLRETAASGRPNRIEHSERLPSERVYGVLIEPVDLALGGDAFERVHVLSFRDISETRRLDRMRSDFVANASHELRTPLASLRGFIETMQGPARNDEKARERFLGIMHEQATRMGRLVDDLLSLSRLELKAHIAPAEKVDLVPLIAHVRDTLTPLAEELDVAISLHMPESAVVEGDRDELVQVFENLMENACKYGQDGRQVTVTLTTDLPGHADVTVSDRGPGIPAEHVPRLTERFYRVNVEASRSKKGTGLGLAIVKHILTRHRARLIVRSKPGEGTDFTVRF